MGLISGTLGAFLRGTGSVLNLSPAPRHHLAPAATRRTDAQAVSDDWVKVGDDIRSAISTTKQDATTDAATHGTPGNPKTQRPD